MKKRRKRKSDENLTRCTLCENDVFAACPSCLNLLCYEHLNEHLDRSCEEHHIIKEHESK